VIHAEYLARIRRRLTIARYPLWAFVILLTVRFWQLQIVRGEEFSSLARDNYLQTERRRAPRGLVVDRAGQVLARSEPSFTLLADTAGLRQLEDLGLLAVEDEDRAGLEARAARGPAVVRSGIPFAEAAFFEARRRELPGVRVEFVPARDYPLGQATAHLLGYVGEVTAAQLLLEEFVAAASGDLVGQDGIERVYNTTLLGSDGYLDRVVASRQRVLVSGGLRRTEPVRGETLQLNVLGALQEAAHRAFGEQRGAFVALDVRTGEVLGLGSYPAENPEDFRGDAGRFRRMLADTATPLLNRAVQGRYPPGSAFKLVTAAAGLAEGVAARRQGIIDGSLDAVATDHAPHHPSLKDRPLADAPPGMIGVETMASVVWSEFVAPGQMSPARFVEIVSTAPARIARITDHGQPIAAGSPANVTVFDAAQNWTVQAETLQSRSLNSPWAGRTLTGRVRHTVLAGESVVVDNELNA